ncbi:hypothetical protein PVAP13_3NG076941 [Panicum virgatum]|uniref:Uncharacterized protein n=1 Tax=Panicum virgatum TaxID=38727 RepID=A0A8T0UG20_PANVG|nr:hypothetical protein PVAP13_3NG076941 [Panicum virgatum]
MRLGAARPTSHRGAGAARELPPPWSSAPKIHRRQAAASRRRPAVVSRRRTAAAMEFSMARGLAESVAAPTAESMAVAAVFKSMAASFMAPGHGGCSRRNDGPRELRRDYQNFRLILLRAGG